LHRVKKLLGESFWCFPARPPEFPDRHRALLLALETIAETPAALACAPAPCIISLGDRQYRLDGGRPVTVSASENCVLLAYLDNPRPRIGWEAASVLDTARLKDRTRLADPGKEIRRLAQGPLGAAISCPGKERKGRGYHVNIRRG
jgi:hypothetical protein